MDILKDWIGVIIVTIQAITGLGVALLTLKTTKLKATIELLEKNTNSIKDELVEVTKQAAFARGVRSQEHKEEESKKGEKK